MSEKPSQQPRHQAKRYERLDSCSKASDDHPELASPAATTTAVSTAISPSLIAERESMADLSFHDVRKVYVVQDDTYGCESPEFEPAC